jgi:hypothetical protein
MVPYKEQEIITIPEQLLSLDEPTAPSTNQRHWDQ